MNTLSNDILIFRFPNLYSHLFFLEHLRKPMTEHWIRVVPMFLVFSYMVMNRNLSENMSLYVTIKWVCPSFFSPLKSIFKNLWLSPVFRIMPEIASKFLHTSICTCCAVWMYCFSWIGNQFQSAALPTIWIGSLRCWFVLMPYFNNWWLKDSVKQWVLLW